MPPAVFSGLIDLKTDVGMMFHRPNAVTPLPQGWDQLFH
jgi:hypothetical protein